MALPTSRITSLYAWRTIPLSGLVCRGYPWRTGLAGVVWWNCDTSYHDQQARCFQILSRKDTLSLSPSRTTLTRSRTTVSRSLWGRIPRQGRSTLPERTGGPPRRLAFLAVPVNNHSSEVDDVRRGDGA
jgi:hypothetical protein